MVWGRKKLIQRQTKGEHKWQFFTSLKSFLASSYTQFVYASLPVLNVQWNNFFSSARIPLELSETFEHAARREVFASSNSTKILWQLFEDNKQKKKESFTFFVFVSVQFFLCHSLTLFRLLLKSAFGVCWHRIDKVSIQHSFKWLQREILLQWLQLKRKTTFDSIDFQTIPNYLFVCFAWLPRAQLYLCLDSVSSPARVHTQTHTHLYTYIVDYCNKRQFVIRPESIIHLIAIP